MCVRTREFWLSTVERVLWTFVQALAAAGLADTADLLQMNWRAAFGTAGFAALVCLAKCLGAALMPPYGSPATLAPDSVGRHHRRDP